MQRLCCLSQYAIDQTYKREFKMPQPQVIFLDAVGTLFGVQGSVGQVYGRLARQAGVAVETASLNQAFFQTFQAAPKAVFPGVPAAEIPRYEFDWWQAIAAQSFERVGVLHQFSDFPGFFAKLYAYFATAEPWFVYPDVLDTLEYWQGLGIELGILSNFDRRLYSVLAVLDLAQFFTSVTISTEIGFAKPEPQIFAAGLEKHRCSAAQAWHIGDSLVEDYQGARAAGLSAYWLQREAVAKAAASITSLSALLPASPG